MSLTGEPALPAGLLDRLRGGDPKAVNDVVAQLYPVLRDYARREVQRGGVHTREADTLVDSVLIRCLRPASEKCADDGELRGFLFRSIRNAIIDEGRRKRPRQFPAEADSGFGPADDTPTPVRRAENEESQIHDQAALDRFLRAIDAADLSPRERELIDLFVVRGMAWEHVAATLQLSSGAARTAMSRARTSLLPQLLAPMRARLREQDWRILEATMINRQRPEDAAADLGLDADEVLNRFMFSVFPIIDRAFGCHGMAMLRRLMHKPAAPQRRP